MKDLIVLSGAPGSGKTTIANLLAKQIGSFVIDFGRLREFHLKPDWSNQSTEEESLAFDNLLYVLRNYKKHGYRNVILTDLQDSRVQQIPEVLPDFDYIIFTLFVSEDAELEKRVEGERDSGFKNSTKALEWNRAVIERDAVRNEGKIDNTQTDPVKTVSQLMALLEK